MPQPNAELNRSATECATCGLQAGTVASIGRCGLKRDAEADEPCLHRDGRTDPPRPVDRAAKLGQMSALMGALLDSGMSKAEIADWLGLSGF